MRSRMYSRKNHEEDIRDDLKELKINFKELFNLILELAKNQKVISYIPNFDKNIETTKENISKLNKLPEIRTSFFSDDVENLETSFEELGTEINGGSVDMVDIKRLKELVKGR